MAAIVTDDRDRETLLTELQIVQAEITRYRDREWTNVGLFTGAIFAVLGFALSYPDQSLRLWWLIEASLVLLSAGNIYYTNYVHNRLTDQRILRSKIEAALGFPEIAVDGGKPFAAHVTPATKTWWVVWRKGFFSHLIPFFVFDVALTVSGLWVVHNGR